MRPFGADDEGGAVILDRRWLSSIEVSDIRQRVRA
jgi:hypothetical protein